MCTHANFLTVKPCHAEIQKVPRHVSEGAIFWRKFMGGHKFSTMDESQPWEVLLLREFCRAEDCLEEVRGNWGGGRV